MAAKGVETMLKTSEMALKLTQNRVSFGLNGSHKARKPNGGKNPRLCPPPVTSKLNVSKEFRPIVAAHGCRNGSKIFAGQDLWNWTFSKFRLATILQSIT